MAVDGVSSIGYRFPEFDIDGFFKSIALNKKLLLCIVPLCDGYEFFDVVSYVLIEVAVDIYNT